MGIKFENVSKSFGNKKILNNISFEIPEDRITAIMGPSGAGKTTIINIILGLITCDSGKITGNEYKKSVVFQEDRLCMNLSSFTNIRIVNEHLREKEIERELQKIGLKDCLYRPVKELSGGMRRRVAILRALLTNYEILLLDEPFQGLDENSKETVIQYIKEKTVGKTVIVITHNKEEAEKLGAEIIYLSIEE